MGKTANNNVPVSVIRRLPRYYRYLSDMLLEGTYKISSLQLAKILGLTASQIRQDLNHFGGFGHQGYGYNVEYLKNEIGKILGTNRNYKLIIIGAGNLGSAISNYQNLKKRGFSLVGVFDADKKKVGEEINGLCVLHVDTLEDFIKEHSPEIAVLTLPKPQVPGMMQRLSEAGISGVWNFSYSDLEISSDIPIESVHLSDSLMMLSYKITEKANGEV